MKKRVFLLVVILVGATVFVGCSCNCGKKVPAPLQALLDEFREEASETEELFGGAIRSAEARDGRKYVLINTFAEQVETSKEYVQQLEISLRMQEFLHVKTLERLREQGVRDPAVVIEYRNADGSLIASVEFTLD